MRVFINCILVTGLINLAACKLMPQPAAPSSQQDYFAKTDSGVQTGGIKMISIHTPKGEFRVWTKTVGNNPKMKLMLLHGGPCRTHAYFVCFDSLFRGRDTEYSSYDPLIPYYRDQ